MSSTPASLKAEPNVTPMIDVMLVLLIIFMIVIPLVVNGFHAQPPRGINLTAHPETERDLVVGLDAAGNFFLDKQPVTEAVLRTRLASRFTAGSDDHVAYLLADKSLPYSRVRDAMDLLEKSGGRAVALVSESPHPESNAGRSAH